MSADSYYCACIRVFQKQFVGVNKLMHHDNTNCTAAQMQLFFDNSLFIRKNEDYTFTVCSYLHDNHCTKVQFGMNETMSNDYNKSFLQTKTNKKQLFIGGILKHLVCYFHCMKYILLQKKTKIVFYILDKVHPNHFTHNKYNENRNK